ncbi:hypothetical protein E0Z10_g1181 [Xylaria hypoxylon]|uniref:DUF1479 domain protein n=1 Tax=Xylaria hypoxylon TaxID=37992 RepID=A0A4Z0YT25_9PEZI|nr:hypothetical protein E0Z10_g1181 [Xylaria hypoxylon]
MAAHNIMSMLDSSEPIPLTSRFAKLKRNMIACREKDVAESFYRLLRALRKEADDIATRGSDVIPTIDYFDIHDSVKASAFRKALRRRGVAVIKHVVPSTVAQAWKEETLDYIADNPQTRGYPPHDPQLFDLYWSPSQARARADSRLLDAQRFAMRTWRASDDRALVSAEYPVVYADRLRVLTPDDAPFASGAHIDNGSVERWEPDGYGASGTYSPVFSGRWEEYDPWNSSPRLRITTDLYNRSGSCSMFRMFQGILSLSSIPAGSGALTVCPMLQLSTAYLLLRPFFTPRYKNPAEMGMRGTGRKAELDFLHPNNWNLNVSQTSILHGAVPGYVQELSSALHPHLQLDQTMVSVPDLEPGDYVIWHPDAVHAVDTAWFTTTANPSTYSPPSYPFRPGPPPSSPFSPISTPYSSKSSSRSGSLSSFSFGSTYSSLSSIPSPSYAHTHSRTSSATPAYPSSRAAPDTTLLYIPACPLTQTNALYLSRQRRAFLLGHAAPDFFEAGGTNGSTGERAHTGRAGVQDIADAGGEEGLRSMGLTPWGEPRRSEKSRNSREREREREKDVDLLRLANGILFPDRFDGVWKKGGGRR